MGRWPLYGSSRFESLGVSGSTDYGTSFTPGASDSKSGTWTQIVAATAEDASGILVIITDAQNDDALIDIAIGGAGSEKVLLSNLIFSGRDFTSIHYYFPIHIPKGTRLSVDGQNSAAAPTAMKCQIILFTQGFNPGGALGIVDTYGANTGDSGGTEIDPGGTANTKGGWTEVVASTSRPIRYINMAFGFRDTFTQTDKYYRVDLGVGASTAEKVIIGDIVFVKSSTTDIFLPSNMGFPVSIPSGSRLSVNMQSQDTDATDRLTDVVLYGVA